MNAAGSANHPEIKIGFPIIGIGASAGGLDPFKKVLETLPADFGAAVVFIQHLLADKKSLLPEIMRKQFPSREIIAITNGMAIEKGKVYVNQPDHDITMDSERFRAELRRKEGVHLPIDTFFCSLAETARESAIAVILSGAGTDGSRGVREVQCKGGAVLVQDPETAEVTGMPNSAIEAGAIDEVLTPENIALRLVALVGAISRLPDAARLENQSSLKSLLEFIREKADFRFDDYKKTVIARRVQRRMSLRGLASIEDYIVLLDKNPDEIDRLAADLMIGVTSFFRDAAAWEALKRDVIHPLVTNKKSAESIRVWTPGCSTGEEAYSIVMMLLQEIEAAGTNSDIQVFGTDINEASLATARLGKYPGSVAADMPAEYLKAYFNFIENGSHVQVKKNVRDHVVFAKQNLLTDPPFSKLDLIVCRNLLIYLEPEAQQKCISNFHYALKENSFLFLGNAESIEHRKGLFKSLGVKRNRIFQRIPQANPPRYSTYAPAVQESKKKAAAGNMAPGKEVSITRFAHETLLALYAPAAVLVNNRYEILHFNGPVKRFLVPPADLSFFDFIAWIPGKMRNRVRGALYNASQTPEPVSIQVGLPDAENKERTALLTIRSFKNPADSAEVFLVTFSDNTMPQRVEGTVLLGTEADRAALSQLERELSTTRNELQTNVEELKSSNEELQSSNEELEAANEEMETSREELQSINEELITVNAQLQSKIEEQEATNNDLNNFLSSTNIPTLFLDFNLKVRRFTPSMTALINLIPSDIGRSVTDLALERMGAGLTDDIRKARDGLETVKNEIAVGAACYLRSSFPFRTSENRVEGVVVTYVDITEQKSGQRENEFLANILEASSQAFGVGYPDGRLGRTNTAFENLTGYSREELNSLDWASALTPPEWREIERNKLEELQKTGLPVRYEKEYIRKDGTRVPIELLVHVKSDAQGQPLFYFSFLTDITERKQAEEELKKSRELAEARAKESEEAKRLLDTLLEYLPEGIVISRGSGTPVRISKCLQEWLGTDKSEFSFDEWTATMPIYDVVSKKRIDPQELPVGRVTRTGEIIHDALYLLRPEIRPERLIAGEAGPVLDSRGNHTGVVVSWRDVSAKIRAEEALRESEARYRTLFETMTEGFSLDEMIFDDEGNPRDLRYLMVNPAFERQTGLKAADVVGKTVLELFPASESVWFERYGKVVITGEPAQFEERFGPLDRWFQVNAFPIGGNKFAVVFTDISQRRHLETSMRETNALLEARNAELDSFNYSVSHDLRGPLRAIDAFDKLLLAEYGSKIDGPGKEYLDQISKSTARMAQIIEDLLRLSRITRAEIRPTQVDLGGIARTLATQLQRSAPDRKVDFIIGDAAVYADPGLMKIVIENLISNSWKFTSKKPHARIEVSCRPDDGRTVCYVRDNGEGFDMAHSRRLFTPFHRLHSISEFPGTGIGLAIIRRIIDRHGGSVWAEGEVGNGATIYFEIPGKVDIEETGGG
jgi:two-component system CheB/CheR fusion protein